MKSDYSENLLKYLLFSFFNNRINKYFFIKNLLIY